MSASLEKAIGFTEICIKGFVMLELLLRLYVVGLKAAWSSLLLRLDIALILLLSWIFARPWSLLRSRTEVS